MPRNCDALEPEGSLCACASADRDPACKTGEGPWRVLTCGNGSTGPARDHNAVGVAAVHGERLLERGVEVLDRTAVVTRCRSAAAASDLGRAKSQQGRERGANAVRTLLEKGSGGRRTVRCRRQRHRACPRPSTGSPTCGHGGAVCWPWQTSVAREIHGHETDMGSIARGTGATWAAWRRRRRRRRRRRNKFGPVGADLCVVAQVSGEERHADPDKLGPHLAVGGTVILLTPPLHPY